jgi:hypothetical protein
VSGFVETEAEDPIGTYIGGDVEDEAHAKDDAIAQDQRDGEDFCRRQAASIRVFAAECREQKLGRGDNSESEEAAENQTMLLAA